MTFRSSWMLPCQSYCGGRFLSSLSWWVTRVLIGKLPEELRWEIHVLSKALMYGSVNATRDSDRSQSIDDTIVQ
jgi:hypothetical protein